MIIEHIGIEGTRLRLGTTHSNRLGLVAQLADHWTSIPKVAGSIPTIVREPAQYTLKVT